MMLGAGDSLLIKIREVIVLQEILKRQIYISVRERFNTLLFLLEMSDGNYGAEN